MDGVDEDLCEERWEATCIEPGLFLGGASSALDTAALRRNAIVLIISILSEEDTQASPPDDIRWERLTCHDRSDADILRLLHPAADRLAQAQEAAAGGTLLHCQEGRSRSVTVMCAYLIKHRRMSLRSAIEYVKGKRPAAEPNRGFWRQLLEFEFDCLGERSFTEAELPGSVMFEREELDAIILAHRYRFGDDLRAALDSVPGLLESAKPSVVVAGPSALGDSSSAAADTAKEKSDRVLEDFAMRLRPEEVNEMERLIKIMEQAEERASKGGHAS